MNTHVSPASSDTLRQTWQSDARWSGIQRPYAAEDVLRLRGTVRIEHTMARLMAEKLWTYLHEKPFVNALGALTGNQAMQQVRAGLDAIYLSGWQVAADANLAGQMYPDQSLYPADSVPAVVKRINQTLRRADEICHAEGNDSIDWYKPIVADAEAGFGGVLNAFELMKQMIESGAAGVHFEDQLSSAKKCGHMGGKVLVPTQEAVAKLVAARLAADVCDVPTLSSRVRMRKQQGSSPQTSMNEIVLSSSQKSALLKGSSKSEVGLIRRLPADLRTHPMQISCGAKLGHRT
jgi:isocitrate lyase